MDGPVDHPIGPGEGDRGHRAEIGSPRPDRARPRPRGGELAFLRLVGFALDGPVGVIDRGLPGRRHVLSDDDEPGQAVPGRSYTETPGLMSHMLRFANTFKQAHGRLPTVDERAAERERFKAGTGMQSLVDGSERKKRARREAYLRSKARVSK